MHPARRLISEHLRNRDSGLFPRPIHFLSRLILNGQIQFRPRTPTHYGAGNKRGASNSPFFQRVSHVDPPPATSASNVLNPHADNASDRTKMTLVMMNAQAAGREMLRSGPMMTMKRCLTLPQHWTTSTTAATVFHWPAHGRYTMSSKMFYITDSSSQSLGGW